jgi:hypothetical protein
MPAFDPPVDKESRERIRRTLPEFWVSHLAQLDGSAAQSTAPSKSPFSIDERLQRLNALVEGRQLNPSALADAQRLLTPRQCYQAAPLSYLDVYGGAWALAGEDDLLDWAGTMASPPTVELWFRDVAIGQAALVVVNLTVGATNGSVLINSSAAPPRTFPVSGFGDHTFDLIVTPPDAFAALIGVRITEGVTYLRFRSASFQPI